MKTGGTVFIVDADREAREAVRSLASTMNLQCETYASGRDFLSASDGKRRGCVILEVRIPGVNGLRILEHLNAIENDIPVLFLAEGATVSIAVRAMRAGAVHFLEKPLREHELWDAIQEAIELDHQRRKIQHRRKRYQSKLASLNPREKQVLAMIAQGESKKRIAQELRVCPRTVDVKRSHVMKKLGIGSLAELVQFAILAIDACGDDILSNAVG